MTRTRSPWWSRIALVVVLAAVAAAVAVGMRPKPITVEVVSATRGTVRDEVSSSKAGEVVAEQRATVRAAISGRVLTLRKKRGERVRKGEVIVALDPADLEARLKQAEATLTTQRAQLTQAEVHAEAAQATAAREKRLADNGAETDRMAEDAAAQAREASGSIKVVRSQIDQSEAAVEVARVARTRTVLTAPFDGLISELYVNQGDEVPAGSNVFELIDDTRLHVEATIDEADIERVRVGQPAKIRLEALRDHPVDGTISRLDPTVRRDEKGARTLRIEVDVDKKESAHIRAGMSANVDIRVAEKDDVLSLPTNVIVGRGTKRSVFVIEQGVARERTIGIGLSSWERTEIVSGVRAGESVISTLNVTGLVDGARVVERAP